MQNPPPGKFDRTDLTWAEKVNQGGGNSKTVQKATILWERLQDFVDGEKERRSFPCTFLKHNTLKNRAKKERTQVKAESPIQEIRLVTQSLRITVFLSKGKDLSYGHKLS
jgi:hypothetical protein